MIETHNHLYDRSIFSKLFHRRSFLAAVARGNLNQAANCFRAGGFVLLMVGPRLDYRSEFHRHAKFELVSTQH
jgi:hypothetical protein